MSESILNALVQLFALSASVTAYDSKGRQLVENLLNEHLSSRFVNEYLNLYDSYIDFFQRDIPNCNDNSIKESEVVKPYVEKVCAQIRKGLPKTDRVVVFLKLLEFVNTDSKISPLEEGIVDTVAECFSIDAIEAKHLKCFVIYCDCEEINPKNLIYIESKPKFREDLLEGIWVEQNKPDWLEEERIILNESIEGRILLLQVSSISAFIMRYFGTAELYLDGLMVEPGKHYFLEEGAIIRGPKVSPIYYTDLSTWILRSERKNRIIFAAENLEFSFRNSSNGIHRFNFSEESGQLIGIMGGSGVGKSTLLNLLTGKLTPRSGRVLINGYDIHRDKQAVEGIIGYVPQDDLLFENLTVYQNLYYNAKLCFSNFTEFKIRHTVKRILDDLDLWDIRNLRVGSPLNKMISGGQRKRLNIGLELMREPSILFVDEPTSGLASSDSLMVMRLLKAQANKGRLVIVNIHQPSSKVFRLLDKLWVLDKGGYPIYSGNPQDAIVYFKTMSTQVNASESACPQCGTLNPDQILEIVEAKVVDQSGNISHTRQRSPQEWNNLYNENIDAYIKPKSHRSLLPKNFFNIPNIEVQFKVFSIRNLLSKITNKQYIIINLLEAPILAFILAFFTKYIISESYIFADNKNLPAYMFMSILVALFIGLTVSAEEIINDQKILERESFLNLSRFSYLNAKIFYLFALSAIQMAMFVLVGNSILEIKGMMLHFWLILFTTSCFANMIGLNISAGLNSVVTIYITIPFILVPQILLSGTVVQFDNLHPAITQRVYVPVVGDLMVSRWAFEAMSVEQFKGNDFQKHFFKHEQTISNAHFKSAFIVPRLQTLLEESQRLYAIEGYSNKRFRRNLDIVRNEFIALHLTEDVPPFEFIGNLNPADFTQEVADEANGYLFFIRMTFTNIANMARSRKDSVYTALVDSLGTDAVYRLRQQNFNKSLADWLLNTSEVNKYLETDSRIIRKFEPIFMIPEHNWGRAQFYAPVKRFNNQLVDTIWFNLAVIWMASLALFVTLQINLLGSIIKYFETLRLRKMIKREQGVV